MKTTLSLLLVLTHFALSIPVFSQDVQRDRYDRTRELRRQRQERVAKTTHPILKAIRTESAASILSLQEPIDIIFFTTDGTLLLGSDLILTRLPDGEPPENLALVLNNDVSTIRQEGDLIFAEGVSGVFRSHDDGKTWIHVLDEWTVSLATTPTLLVAGGFSGEVWVSEDDGNSWTLSNGIVLPDIFFSSKLAAFNDVIIYSAFIDPFRVSTNRGQSWVDTPYNGGFLWSNSSSIFSDLIDGVPRLDRTVSGTLWLEHADHQLGGLVFQFYEDERVRIVSDNFELQFQRPGESWLSLTAALAGQTLNTFAIAPDGRLWYGTEEGGLGRSTDPIVDPLSVISGTVSVSELTFMFGAEDEQTTSFLIANTGTGLLSFDVSTPSSFLFLSPISGTLSPGSIGTVSVTVNVSGLPSGTYQATVTVNLAGSEIIIPVTIQIMTSTDTEVNQIPSGRELQSVYPNPTSGETIARLELNHSTDVEATVFDVLGRKRFTTNFGTISAGEQILRLDLSVLPPGFYVLVVNGGVIGREMLIVR